jgi:aromatic ring-opening dioxygenase catalytic subunit (LigB family)
VVRFPQDLEYPARGDPEVSQMVADRFQQSGIPFEIDTTRGLDHGAYMPLHYILPEAEIPVIQLSIVEGFDPATHFAIGRALESLRDEGVAIIGSGMTFHNSDGYSESENELMLADSLAFASDITSALNIADPEARGARLEEWTSFAKASMNHADGGDDHFVPVCHL